MLNTKRSRTDDGRSGSEKRLKGYAAYPGGNSDPDYHLAVELVLQISYSLVKNMSSVEDPFYIVTEEIQQSSDKLQYTFHQWESMLADSKGESHLTKELLAGCESVQWQVDELDKTISVAAKDPSFYGISEVELEQRRRWTRYACTQVSNVKNTVMSRMEMNNTSTSSGSRMRRELMRLPNTHQPDSSGHYNSKNDDDYISSESDRQLLLIKQQDEELDELSASVERIGGVGLTIHEELLAQDRIIDGLGSEMDNTSNRLDFVQKKVAMVMKKASAKGQLLMILFLVALLIVLFVLVFS